MYIYNFYNYTREKIKYPYKVHIFFLFTYI